MTIEAIQSIDLAEKFAKFKEHWSPHVLGQVNTCSVKIAKFLGEFPWHSHEHEDEMFFVVKGEMMIRLRDKDLHLAEGQFAIVPAGVEHQPFAENEAWVMLFEPSTTKNTGGLEGSEFTKTELPKI